MFFNILSIIAIDTFYCNIATSSVTVSSSKILCNSTEITLTSRTPKIFIVGDSETNTISSSNIDSTFVLQSNKISSQKDKTSPFSINGGNTNIILTGKSTLFSKDETGILCQGNANITFSGEKDGIIDSTSALYSGIGGGFSSTTCNSINVKGKITIYANGGYYGAGIGAGYGTSAEGLSNVNEINVYDGNIVATSQSSAGIGGGEGIFTGSSCINQINIYGGNINTTGGEWGAGIGGGYGYKAGISSVKKITISGGNINAKGGKNAAGIGAGFSISHDSSNVDQITLISNKDQSSQKICLSINAIGGARATGIGNGNGGVVNKIDEIGSSIVCQFQTCTFSTSSTDCIKPWKCNVNNCLLCPNSDSVCTKCEDNFVLENNMCVSGDKPTTTTTTSSSTSSSTTTTTTTTSSSSKTSIPTSEPVTTTQVPPIAGTVVVAFCTNEYASVCQRINTNWTTVKTEILTNFSKKMEVAPVKEVYTYKIASKIVNEINEIDSIVNNNINEYISGITKENLNVIILQFGSNSNSNSHDFNNLKVKNININVISLIETGDIVLNTGDFQFINHLSFIFGAVSFVNSNPTILTNVYLFSAKLVNKSVSSINLKANYLLAQEDLASKCNTLEAGSVKKFDVLIPRKISEIIIEFRTSSVYISTPLSRYTRSASADDIISTRIASEQTGIICDTSKITFALDPVTQAVDYSVNVSVQENNENIDVSFSGQNWNNCNFSKSVDIDTDKNSQVKLNSKPENVNVEITKRNDDSSDVTKKPKSGLSTGAIVGIVIAVLVLSALIIFIVVWFVCLKNKRELDEYGDKMAQTSLLKSNENI